MRQESGFTLIELVVVIVILGILAAFAVPRFVGMQDEARTSTLKGLKGSLHGAASLAHGKHLANSTAVPGDNINIQGQEIEFTGSWPAATDGGISEMIQDLSGYDYNSSCSLVPTNFADTCIEFYPEGVSSPGNCYTAYGVNGSGSNAYPVFDYNASDCS